MQDRLCHIVWPDRIRQGLQVQSRHRKGRGMGQGENLGAEPVVFLPGMMCDARIFTPQILARSKQTPVMAAALFGGETVCGRQRFTTALPEENFLFQLEFPPEAVAGGQIAVDPSVGSAGRDLLFYGLRLRPAS